MCTKHERAMKTPLPRLLLGRYTLRSGKQQDSAKIKAWSSNDLGVRGALEAAVGHLQAEDGATFVVVVEATGRLVGLVTIEVPHLQFAFFVEEVRGKGIATAAAAELIEHYFGTSSEPWIGDSGSLTPDGETLVVRLGFEEKEGWYQLTRRRWSSTRSKFIHRAR